MSRTLSLLLSIIVVAFGGWLHAVELIGRPQATTTATGAIITWKTDVECGTRLTYGLNAAQLNQKVEGPVAREHKVVLAGLATGTVYHFSVGSARKRLATGSFVTGGPQPSIVRRLLDAITPDKKTGPQSIVSSAPPARETWGNPATLRDHFDRHGPDFGSKSPDDYAAQAWSFLQRARAESLPMKLDETDGTLRVFDPESRAFAAYNDSGRTKTFFKPESPTYWQRQPGRSVKPSELRFSPR